MNLRWVDRQVLATSLGRVVKRDTYQRLLEAAELTAALDEATSAARMQLSRWRDEAQRAGYQAGLDQARREWAQQLAGAHLTRHAQLLQLQPVLAEIVVQAVRHLLGQLPPELCFEQLAHRVLDEVIRARRLRLVVSPSDAPSARALVKSWHPGDEAGAACPVELVVDPALQAGDCIVETDEGTVDGRLGERLAAIHAALARSLSTTPDIASEPRR